MQVVSNHKSWLYVHLSFLSGRQWTEPLMASSIMGSPTCMALFHFVMFWVFDFPGLDGDKYTCPPEFSEVSPGDQLL